MRTIFLFLLILIYQANLSAQNKIKSYEYWFDNDYLQRVQTSISPVSAFQLIANIPVNALKNGVHTHNIRFRDDSSRFSAVISQLFIKLPQFTSSNKQVIAYEYWFDNNYDQKIFQAVTPQSSLELTTGLSTASLSRGLHNVNVRFRDNAGLWSSVINQFLVKLPQSTSPNKQVIAYEYWFDNNYDKKVFQSVTPQSSLELTTGLSTGSLSGGLHSVNVRFKDNVGLWSSAINQHIFKHNVASGKNVVTSYRYWFDLKDSSVFQVNLPFPTNPYLLVTSINATALDTGFHTIKFQFKDTNGLWSAVVIDTFYQIGKPQLNSILPKSGGNIGDVTVNIAGNGFFPGTSVKLTRAGYPDIVVPDSLIVIEQGKRVRATFDLRNKTVGLWNVIVTVPNDTVMTLVNGFRIDSGFIIQPLVNVIGFNSIRLNQWQTYTLVCNNPGNVDAKGVPLWLAVPHNASIEFDFKFYPLADPSVNYDTTPKFVTVDTVQFEPFNADVYAFFIPNIPANNLFTLSFKIKVSSASNYKIKAWANPPMYGSPLEYLVGECWDGIISQAVGLIPGVGCVYGLLDVGLSPYFDYYNDPQSLNDEYVRNLIWNFTKTTFGCINSGPKALLLAVDLISGGLDVYDFPYKACAGNLSSFILNNVDINTVTSFDPNEKLGPNGIGAQNYFPANVPYPYVIHFENVDSATAPAQTVLITDTLDLDVFDINTLELGFLKIGDTLLNFPAGLKAYDEYIDLRPKRNIIVRVQAGFNDTTGVLSWRFTSLDPLTYQQVLDPTAGFLPPNVTAPEGDGSVFYTIRLKDTLPNGTLVANKACIYFDNNPPICTNKWINTIDKTMPVSQVMPLAEVQYSTSFQVHWSGSDNGSGISDYTIFVSENGNDYKIWIGKTQATSKTFNGEFGKTYRFYAIATDKVGIVEVKNPIAEATTTLSQPLPITLLNFMGLLRNDDVDLQWTTQSEKNSSHFNIQRSFNGTDFITVGKVNTIGNSTTLKDYYFTDRKVRTSGLDKVFFYRLQIFDLDGRFVFSKIVAVNVKGSVSSITVFPNPVRNEIFILSTKGLSNALVTITDMSGRKVYSKTYNINVGVKMPIPVSFLNAGLYILTIEKDNELRRIKFLKE